MLQPLGIVERFKPLTVLTESSLTFLTATPVGKAVESCRAGNEKPPREGRSRRYGRAGYRPRGLKPSGGVHPRFENGSLAKAGACQRR